ncbi:MAG: hypothetical protein HYV63_22795 [Candidatus Schekmanbacteria bacterium]|nr:hypothetical protein [Candidatus Schekmanbacteria bacterium]
MNTNAASSFRLGRGDAVLPVYDEPCAASRSAPRTSPAARAESLQRAGKGMIFAGFVITIVGVVLYCAVCFAGGMDADMGDLLFENAVPFARATLAVLGVGTLVWLVGSFTYLRGAMDADEDAGRENE